MQTSSADGGPSPRRPATTEEARALANPIRLRILRLCFDESLTNEQLAGRLGRDPATVLHHVRTLVRTGFLEPGPQRPGPRGSVERPYRATGKSWRVEVTDPALDAQAIDSSVEAFAAEVRELGPADFEQLVRLALRVSPESLAELSGRIKAILEEFAARPPDPDGEPWAAFVALHRRPSG